jgi:hypothetical protein
VPGGKPTTAARKALESELGTVPPAGLKKLRASEVQHLADAVATAKREQARALDQALADALNVLPRVLRGPVKKAVGG